MEGLSRSFPLLHDDDFECTSPATEDYNCIAWAAGFDDAWWAPFPRDSAPNFWPPGVPREETVEAFVAVFRTVGFRCCTDGVLELGFEKIAIFADGVCATHAARQLPDGAWTSKLGPEIDITHRRVEDVAGPCYGEPVQFMKRRRVTSSRP